MELYFGMRTMCNAWARAGNYLVDSKEKPDTQVLMMPFDAAMDYADSRFRLAWNSGMPCESMMNWLASKDFLTRTIMSNYIRNKYHAVEALARAVHETANDWARIVGGELRTVHREIFDAASQATD